ncbi:homocysteine S-methyltransferase [Fructobacillus tropaeoli]|uniref:homocysteine S-methyltransferase n=1 Tax=Fructobacillus tropaeoli TaxID=709323 RepID=UPI002DA92B5F|nr:Homocysteine/selenocysteine methylase (S-methylmethionine-dependent) (MHT1) [Fructobacillus tropaeoli]
MNFHDWAKQQKTILFDSSMGLGLSNQGFDTNNPLWTAKALITDPDKVYQVHLDFFNAGSNITTTDSYQASTAGFAKQGLGRDEAEKLIKQSVALAEKASFDRTGQQDKWVAGNIGPYGAYLANGAEYTGDYGEITDDDLRAFHEDRLQWLVEAGSDLIAVQTVPSFAEIKVLCQLLNQYPDVDVLFTCSLKDSQHISDGTDLREVQAVLETQENVIAYGFNCFKPEFTEDALDYITATATTDKAIAVAPNAGADYDPVTKTWGEPNEKIFSEKAPSWRRHGASWISGCCEMIPAELKKVRTVLFEK